MTKKLLLSILSLVMIASFFCAPVSAKGVEAIDVNLEESNRASAGEYGLNDLEYSIYCELKDFIKSVACGDVSNAEYVYTTNLSTLTWTADELGCKLGDYLSNEAEAILRAKFIEAINFEKVYLKLLYDLPYDLYWHDKTQGVEYPYDYACSSSSVKITSIKFSFYVSADYSESGEEKTFVTSTEDIARANEVIDAAKAIVEKNKELSDVEKFNSYITEIMALVDYNFPVADSSENTLYGDPWQIIWVFDNDESTKVVCEGFAKAFKYLCDLTEFENDVECYLASGDSGNGPHMWNVVSVNGANYLVDITLLESTYSSQTIDFLWGGKTEDGGKSHSISLDFLGYMAPTYVYVYEDFMQEIYGEGYPELNRGNYHVGHNFDEDNWHFNGFEHWIECFCGVKKDVASHDDAGRAATCTEKAICGVCNIEYGKTLDHNYGEDNKCVDCGEEKKNEVTPDDNEQENTPENPPENNNEDKNDDDKEENTPSILDEMKERIDNEEPANIFEAIIVLFLGIFKGIMKIIEVFA